LSRSFTLDLLLSRVSRVWQDWWFDEIPPHIYALLRILLGLLGCVTLLGVSNLSEFWDLGGFVSAEDRGLGLKAFLLAHNLGTVGGRGLFFGSFGVFAAMAAGVKTNITVPLGLFASLMDLSWNYLPHSGAYSAMLAVLFCLVWTDCGSVWSFDSWLARRQGAAPEAARYPIAPLRLIRLQVGLIYLSTGIRKLYSEHWRDGSAIHYVLSTNVYQRFPHDLPLRLEPIATLLTYIVLVWEVGFLFAVLWRPTRRLVLVLGVLLHLGMQAMIEIGPFAWVMLASYAAFLEPSTVPALPRRAWNVVTRLGRSAETAPTERSPIVAPSSAAAAVMRDGAGR
jgi:Vitamin K-dependent gamma-carboxylase